MFRSRGCQLNAEDDAWAKEEPGRWLEAVYLREL